ncbi:hypothetical protein THAOC_16217 [Thalassiosira oceanica]|uniref:Uncharacterized protein n=1 Tax=Thalassiosira oceanica TaxID=159749 RepID=K0SAK2_THAOC|nr:hypothetical protein THAOC_16217 [Thalassiosira oceanica]|eukprot:EJK63143.1 hypothetical protein THAOC_16217 [Thalassiosira oceanica]
MSKKQKKQLNKFFPGKKPQTHGDAGRGRGPGVEPRGVVDIRRQGLRDSRCQSLHGRYLPQVFRQAVAPAVVPPTALDMGELCAGGRVAYLIFACSRTSTASVSDTSGLHAARERSRRKGRLDPQALRPGQPGPHLPDQARAGEEPEAGQVAPVHVHPEVGQARPAGRGGLRPVRAPREDTGPVGRRRDSGGRRVVRGARRGVDGAAPGDGGAGAGMMQGWDERVQMNMMNHMMAMQNSMNVMAMNLMTQQRAFGNNGGANGNPQAPQLMGMGGAMPAFNGQHMPMNQSSVQGLLAQIDSESLQAALLARAIMENRRQDASGAGPGQAQPSGAQNVGATSVQDRAVDGGPVECQKPSQAIDQSIDDQKLHSDRQRMSPEKDS